MPSTDRPAELRATPAQMARLGGQTTRMGALRQIVQWHMMRATRVSTGLLVYWESHSDPDWTGTQSGYPGDVTDVCDLGVRFET